MATLAALKKKLANLEAQVEKVTKAEMGSAIAKVRKIMADFGLTVEHLTANVTAGKTVAKKSKSAKALAKATGSKPAKYRDPATGVTWAGVGRAPGWIANSKNRDEFLIAKPADVEGTAKPTARAKKAAVKRAAPVKRSKVVAVAKKAVRKIGATTKRASNAPTPEPVAKKAAAKKGVAKKAASKKVAGRTARKGAASKTVGAPTASNKGSSEASSN